MKKSKHFDAVKMMRDIRDRMSAEMSEMSQSRRLSFIDEMSGLRRDKRNRKSVVASGEHRTKQ